MSDDAIRAAERTYRASGSPADGEAYVQAVLRTTGLNSTFLIARVIETQRALHALADHYQGFRFSQNELVHNSLVRPVTPDDMVSFLRGGREWLEPPRTVLLHAAVDAPPSEIRMYSYGEDGGRLADMVRHHEAVDDV